VVKLCDLSGHPYREENLMHRLALGRGRGAGRQDPVAAAGDEADGGFTRTLNYPLSGLA
jgi:hypothetical protein